MHSMAVPSQGGGVAALVAVTSVLLAVGWLAWAVCSILAGESLALAVVAFALLAGNVAVAAIGARALLGCLPAARRERGVPFREWFGLLCGTVLAAMPVGAAAAFVAAGP